MKRNRQNLQSFLRLAAFAVLAALLANLPLRAQNFGTITGVVTDRGGDPLMGSTVLVSGPLGPLHEVVGAFVERVMTDAQGRFVVERLTPGWYSLRVLAPARLPAMRDHVHVQAGETTQQKFVLADVFANSVLAAGKSRFSTWGDDWKWILRTSSSTRPLLRFQHQQKQASAPPAKNAALTSQRLIAMVPQSSSRGADQSGLASVLAYSEPLGQTSDLLVAGSLSPSVAEGASFAAAYRRGLLGASPQQLSIAVHQLSLEDAVPGAIAGPANSLLRAQGIALAYSQQRRLSGHWILDTGFEIDYLNGLQDVGSANPRLALEYRRSPSSKVVFSFGAPQPEQGNKLLDRISNLDAFPRVTMNGNRLALETVRHAEAAFDQKFGSNSEFLVAVYHDAVDNAAVWGFGPSRSLSGFEGDLLLNPAVGGVILDSGAFHASGVQVAYMRGFGKFLRAGVAYNLGQALQVYPVAVASELPADWQGILRSEYAGSISTVVTAFVPRCRTRISASFSSMPKGTVTVVDPYTNGPVQAEPFVGLQIRQPIPTLAFLPAHIEALADFQNVLNQGAVPIAKSGNQPFDLVPAYRSFRGGFSVLF